MHIYKVHIRANVNTWRGSDYQTVPLYVLDIKFEGISFEHHPEEYHMLNLK